MEQWKGKNNKMTTFNTRLATKNDVEGILALQTLNLFANLSEAERQEGFVTTPFTVEQIEALLAEDGVFVADMNHKIVGYAYAGSWQYFSQWPIFPFMVSRFPDCPFRGEVLTMENSFQYGPVCIDHSLRGTDAFSRLFAAMRKGMSDRYPIGGTFINQINARSVKAHTQKLDLEIIDDFGFNGQRYFGLAFFTEV
jgi:hypothetical protein